MEAIERTLEFEAPLERVWKAITDPTELAQWFGDTADLELKVGGTGFMAWEEHGSFPMLVEECDPPHRLAWRWGKEAGDLVDGGSSTLVEWTLSPRDSGGTTLYLRESGFQTEDARKENVGGWKHELGELLELLGEPVPAAG